MEMMVAATASLFGGGAAASTASVIGTASTIVGGLAGLAQISYQNKIAANMAATAQENSNRALTEGQQTQKDQDFEAQAQMAAVADAQSSQGFSVSSPTYERVRSRNIALARRDAERIRQGAEDTANNFQTQKTDALNSKQSLLLPMLSLGLDVKSSMISGSSLVRKTKIAQNNNSTRSIEV